MEKTEYLSRVNQEVCGYYEQYNIANKDEIECFKPDRKELNDFYGSMSDHFFRKRLKENVEPSKKCQREARVKEKILNRLKNPLATYLPKQMDQDNLISVGQTSEMKVQVAPMFSGVERSKKGGTYVMGNEVKKMVSEDIQNMVEKKEEQFFRKKFPHPRPRQKEHFSGDDPSVENQIKVYNRILAKYKKDNAADSLKLVDECHYPELVEELILDNQFFDVLGLFKKLYMEAKTELVTDGLMKYILKFQKYDKMTRKIKNNSKSNLKYFKRFSSELQGKNNQEGPTKNSTQQNFYGKGHQRKNSLLNQFVAKEEGKGKKTVMFKTRIHSVKQSRGKAEGVRLKI